LEIFLAGRPTLLMLCWESNCVNMAAGHIDDSRKVNETGCSCSLVVLACLLKACCVSFWLYLLFLNRDIKNSNCHKVPALNTNGESLGGSSPLCGYKS
jgi:hypothetical protein